MQFAERLHRPLRGAALPLQLLADQYGNRRGGIDLIWQPPQTFQLLARQNQGIGKEGLPGHQLPVPLRGELVLPKPFAAVDIMDSGLLQHPPEFLRQFQHLSLGQPAVLLFQGIQLLLQALPGQIRVQELPVHPGQELLRVERILLRHSHVSQYDAALRQLSVVVL